MVRVQVLGLGLRSLFGLGIRDDNEGQGSGLGFVT